MAGTEDRDTPEDELDINLEDLEAEPVPSPGTVSGDTLVIEADDLADVADSPAYPAAPASYPPVSPTGEFAYAKGKKGAAATFVGSLMLQLAIAGALGGLLAWSINEPRSFVRDRLSELPSTEVYQEVALFTAILGSAIGLLLGLTEGLTSLNWRRATVGGLLGVVIGGLGGGFAGVLAQMAYGALGGRSDELSFRQIIARSIGWCIVGLFVGLAQGAATRSTKKIVNGLCGGAMGGFAGGFVFDLVGVFGGIFGLHGSASRLIAQVAIGLATGVAIGLLEELLKEAWLVIVGGPLTGKQFVLYQANTVVGSSPKCDIALLKDTEIAPQHFSIAMAGANCVLTDLGSPRGTLVNGRPVQRHNLRRGDVIQVGQTALEYHDRTLPSPEPGRRA